MNKVYNTQLVNKDTNIKVAIATYMNITHEYFF